MQQLPSVAESHDYPETLDDQLQARKKKTDQTNSKKFTYEMTIHNVQGKLQLLKAYMTTVDIITYFPTILQSLK